MKNVFLSKMNSVSKNSLAILAGVLLTLAFAPFFLFPLAVISAVFLLFLWLDITPQQAFMRGFFYGLGLFGSGVYWVYISIHTYAELPAAIAAALTCLFVACLALFPACQGWILNRYFPRTNNTKLLCAFPASWVLFEWTRSWIFSGFPWLFVGYSQTYSPLNGYAPILSVYGISLAAVLSAGLITNAYLQFQQKHRLISYGCLLLLALIWIGGGILHTIAWTTASGHPIKVSLIQANIPQQLKWAPEQVDPTMKQYQDLSKPHWDSQLIIWPEAAIPAPLGEVTGFIDYMAFTAKHHHATLITGIPVKSNLNDRYYNAVISVGDNSGYYLKHRLVPFGEFIPMENILGRVFDLLHVPMSDFTADEHLAKPLIIGNNVKLLAFICYEIAFPEQVLTRAADIGVLLTVTNDAWFGHSIAQAQHLQMAQMRALEMGRPVLFASNNGITALILENGRIAQSAPPYETYVLTGMVQPFTGKTPWQLYAMDPILLILISLFFVAFKHRKTP